MAYRIRDWAKHFEHGDHKKTRMHWVKMPNKHDGLGYRRVMLAGESHYACWVLLVQVASKATVRGWLVDDQGRGLTGEDLELKTGMGAKRFDAAFPVLEAVAWLEVIPQQELEASFKNLLESSKKILEVSKKVLATEEDSTGQKRREETDSSEAEKLASKPSEPSLLSFETVGKVKRWELTQAQVDNWSSLYPALDILGECRRALAWTQAKPANRKTFGGMPSFLVGWFNRATSRGPCARNDALFRRRDGSTDFAGMEEPETEVRA